MGTAFGGAKGRRRVPELTDWYMDGKVMVDELVTQEIPLDKINWALEQMAGKLRYAVLTELANADPELARLKANDVWLLGTSKLAKPVARSGELRKVDEETV